ncbi:MAG: hypothetical protein U0840_01290 [Gemmataceae bacterium]
MTLTFPEGVNRGGPRTPQQDLYRVVFLYANRKYSYSLETSDLPTANALRGGVEKTLMLLGQGALSVPDGASVVEFVKHGGRLPSPPPGPAGQEPKDAPVRLADFKTRYLEARSGGSMEQNSLATARMHLGHFERTLGADFDLRKLTLTTLQEYLTRRRKQGDPRRKKPAPTPLSPATLRLEMATLRAAWNWGGCSTGVCTGRFPRKDSSTPRPTSSRRS